VVSSMQRKTACRKQKLARQGRQHVALSVSWHTHTWRCVFVSLLLCAPCGNLQEDKPGFLSLIQDMLRPESLPEGWTAQFDPETGVCGGQGGVRAKRSWVMLQGWVRLYLGRGTSDLFCGHDLHH
jgi:hypothetical protein